MKNESISSVVDRYTIGLAGKAVDRTLALGERGLTKLANWGGDTPVGAAAKVLTPVAVGIRAINANVTSGHGQHFTPVPRDERFFSEDALKNLARNLDEHGGKGTGRYASNGIDSPGAFEASQAVGGSTVKDGKLTDVFDINHTYDWIEDLKKGGTMAKIAGHYADAVNKVAGVLFGSDLDADRGKVRTAIPLSALAKYRRDDKGGDNRFSASRNFLASDRVPETIFGIPVASKPEHYTQADLDFFRDHPEAGGYYETGEESSDESAPAAEAVPAQGMGEVQPEEPAGEMVPEMAVRQTAKGGDAKAALYGHLKESEGLRRSAYIDPGDGRPAIGYGAHEIDGVPVRMGQRISVATALRTMRDDVAKREARLSRTLPGWKSMDDGTRAALIDVSFGKTNVLADAEGGSPGLHRDLRAAGDDPDRLRAAVMKHYPTYRNSDSPETRAGLQNRRVRGMKAFFGEDFSYEGKEWNPETGFVEKGGK